MISLIVKPRKSPELREIENSLIAKQRIVGGSIDILDPWDDSVVIVFNDDGKSLGLLPNRRITDKISINGTFLICGITPEGDMIDLTDSQILHFTELFKCPEILPNTQPRQEVLAVE